MESGLADVLSFNLLSRSGSEGVSLGPADPSRALRVAIKQACLDILPEAVGLTDGFGFNDWELDRYGFRFSHYFSDIFQRRYAVHSVRMTVMRMKRCGRGFSPNH